MGDLHTDGYDRSVELLRRCATEHGFIATPTDQFNYRRVWARDSSIMGLAALLIGDTELVACCRRTLEMLAEHQGPHGEVPSNVDPETHRISYGGTAGRVDGNLWFVICCAAYWRHTGDDGFLQSMWKTLEKVRFVLGAWEFNCRGLLYVPPTGDWADEYVHSGYVLYDQLLYLQAQREFCGIHAHLHGSTDHQLTDRATRLKHLIRSNYWFWDGDDVPDDVYHEILYEKGRKAAPEREGEYWMPFFSPLGYGYRFDALANALVTLFGVADESQCEAVDRYIADLIVQEEIMLLPAFHPVITPKDEKWNELQMVFSYDFKNDPHEYHNGGLWPMVTGFYVASLARRGKQDLAVRYLEGMHRANAREMDGQPWGFPEYLHGRSHHPGGTSYMGWNAAAAILAHHAIEGTHVFSASRAKDAS